MHKKFKGSESVLPKAFILMLVMVTSVYSEVSKQYLPPFSLRATNGEVYTESDFDDKKVLGIVFLSNHCKVSQLFQNHLIALTRKYSKDMVIIAVSPNYEQSILPDELAYSDLGDSFEDMVKRANRMKYNFPYLHDGDDQNLTKEIGAKITPTIYLYNQDRELFYSGRIGNIDSPDNMETSEVNQAISSLLIGKKTSFKRTKVFGTAIKTKNHLFVAEQVRQRYADEKVRLSEADARKLNFYLTHNTRKPKLFYVWQTSDGKPRDNLIKLSFLYKIFRKRGFKLITVCIAKKDEEDKIVEFLENSQLSSTNFIVYGHHISPLASIIPDDVEKVTPYFRLLSSRGEKLIGSHGEISTDSLRYEIVKALDDSK